MKTTLRFLWLGMVTGLIGAPLGKVHAREFSIDLVIESVEDLYELERSGDLESEEVDLLVALMQSPINVNRADKDLLYELPAITFELADAIIEHRASVGPFVQLEDLLQVKGMTAEILGTIAPFIETGLAVRDGMVVEDLVRGKARLGSIWRESLPFGGKQSEQIDHQLERLAGPQTYLKIEGTGFKNFGAGVLATHRRQTFARWDYDRGQLVTDGPGNKPALDGAYLYWEHGPWSLVVGTYNAGFGERLTFDSTMTRYPHGWYAFNNFREDNRTGRLQQLRKLTGFAVSVSGVDVPGGWIDATVFASYQPRDLYQYDFWYGLDEFDQPNQCVTNSDCPDGYTCQREIGMCRSTRLYNSEDENIRYRYETFTHAFREALGGANFTFNFNERTQIGVTGYGAHVDFRLAEGAQPSFSEAARWPRKDTYGAVGIFGRYGRRNLTLTGEYAYTGSDGKGHAAFLRGVYNPTYWAELVLALRYYSPYYENPHGRGEAAPAQADGLRQRNERGIRLQSILTPIRRTRIVTDIDVFQRPWEDYYEDGLKEWELADMPWLDTTRIRARQRVIWGFTNKEELLLTGQYDNKGLGRNERSETYELGDLFGFGERRMGQIGLRTTRIPRTRITARYSMIWQDVRRYNDRFDRQHRLRVLASTTPWSGGRFAGSLGLWFRQVEFNQTRLSDRQEPRMDYYLEYSQRLFGDFLLRGRYGMLHYNDGRPERWSWYQLAKLSLEAQF